MQWSVWGDEIIERELLRFSERGLNMAPAFALLIDDIRESLKEHFDTEGAHGGEQWAPLKIATAESKAAAGLDPRILHATLALRNSLVEDGPGNVAVVGSDSLTYGSEVFYGGFHQRGTSTLLIRKPLEFPETDKVLWMKALQHYLVTGELRAAAAL